MTQDAERLMARPAEFVPVAVAAYEEAWRRRDYPLTLATTLAQFAREEAEGRLREAPERAAPDALMLAWGVVWPIWERLMEQHGYLADGIAAMTAEARDHLGQVGEPSQDR